MDELHRHWLLEAPRLVDCRPPLPAPVPPSLPASPPLPPSPSPVPAACAAAITHLEATLEIEEPCFLATKSRACMGRHMSSVQHALSTATVQHVLHVTIVQQVLHNRR